MRFTKMQGAGNDYVYVDCFAEPPPADPAALARKIADRHFGVGGDGLILICPSMQADARMRMFNADGSESEMCGNGVRCVAKYVYDHGIARKPRLAIETGRGVLALDVEIADGRVSRVRVDMGEPILEPERIPVECRLDQRISERSTSADGTRSASSDGTRRSVRGPWTASSCWSPALKQGGNPIDRWRLDPRMTCVSMGNPHVILYCHKVAAVPLEIVGPKWEHAAIFPRRINVHFVEVHSPGEVTMRTWERGSGITLACGTGASAVCVAGVLSERTDRRILAHLPGGDLELEWRATDNHVYMTGPAVEVFQRRMADGL